MKIIYLFGILVALGEVEAKAVFVPEHEIHYEGLARGNSNITETEFHEIVSLMQRSYQEVAKRHGGNLTVSGDWKSEKLNAGATQMFGSWKVVISGALARRPELTADGTTLILCHELGHHFGGFSFAPAGTPFEKVWAANEGQSDYFATQVCARKIWREDRETNAGFRFSAPAYIKERCDTAWSEEPEQDLCYRISAASQSVGNTMAVLLKKPPPNFETPDQEQVGKTKDTHPAVQCRLDTSFQGALCQVSFDEALIPGKKAAGGPFGRDAELEAARVSCTQYSGQAFGRRPVCWYKPNM